jgi:hypothetical protein
MLKFRMVQVTQLFRQIKSFTFMCEDCKLGEAGVSGVVKHDAQRPGFGAVPHVKFLRSNLHLK